MLLALIVWVIWRIPQLLYAYVPEAKDRAAVEATTRTGLIAALAGLAALGSLAVTNRTYHLSQQGQLTDRYSKAIEQLADDKLEIRLGGLYALERLAVDSKRDHPTVVEVLSTLVRHHTGSAQRENQMLLNAGIWASGTSQLESRADVAGDFRPRPAVDVQAAVTILGRLPRRNGVERGNLAFADLAGATLRQADLPSVSLTGAILMGADLRGANLTDARLDRSNLKGAVLATATLRNANLYGADLAGAYLHGADLATPLLTQEQLDVAKGNEDTRLPPNLERPESW